MGLVNSLYSNIKDEMHNMTGVTSGISQSDMLRRYLGMKSAGEGLRRDEMTFYREVWPKLEGLRKRDRSVQSFTRQ